MNNQSRRTIADYCHGRDNNFNLLRVAAALAVFLSHTAITAGYGVVPVITVLAYVAVNAFFAISGFLVTKSFFTRNKLSHFLASRILRMYPALLLAVLYTVFVVGLYFTTLPAKTYLADPLTQSFLFKNMLQLIWPIPITLPGIPWQPVNAPLWTLPFELHMYSLLALTAMISVCWSGRYRKYVWALYLLVVAVSTLLYVADYAYGLDGYGLGHYRYYLRFIAMFGSGVALYLFRDSVPLEGRYFFALLAIVVVVSPVRGLFVLFAYSGLAYILLYLAYVPGGWLRKYNQLGDYSYGIYIFGYPTQLAVTDLLSESSVIVIFTVSLAVTLLLAVLSWHYLEKPALSLKKRFASTDN